MNEEIDDRGAQRARLSALEEELPSASATLSELRAECRERQKRVAALEQRLALIDQTPRERRVRGKVLVGVFLLPFAALGGGVSGLCASTPLLLAGLALPGNAGEGPMVAVMLGCMAVGAVSAVTLAVRSLRRG